MPQQVIGTGTVANDGTGDTLRAAAIKINAMMAELYAGQGGVGLPGSGDVGKIPYAIASGQVGWRRAPKWDIRFQGEDIACDGATDDAPAITAALETIAAAGAGDVDLVGDDPAGEFYLNSTMLVPSWCRIFFRNGILMGPKGRIGVQGRLVELPETGKYQIRATASAGQKDIQLSNDPSSDYTNFTVGKQYVIRGENDATGNAINKETFWLASINSGTNTITAVDNLQNTYEPSYPSSDWPNDKTLISEIVGSKLAADAVVGAYTLEVADASVFTLGQVTIEDDTVAADVSGTSTNPCRMETNYIVAIETGNVLRFAYPIAHDYEVTHNAVVQKVEPVQGVALIGARIRFDENSDSNSRYSIFTQYDADTFIHDCWVLGDLETGLGPRAPGVRIGEGSLRAVVDACRVLWPAYYGSGQGYGITANRGARHWQITRNFLEGCRHSILAQMGACDGLIAWNFSTDCRGTDIDLHGCGERNILIASNRVTGGPSTTSDITTKGAVKVGNTSHRFGAKGIRVIGNDIGPYDGYGVHVVPESEDTLVKANSFTRCATGGVYVQRPSADNSLAIRKVDIEQNSFDGMDNVLDIAGGSDGGKTVVDIRFADNDVKRAPGLAPLIDADWVDGLTLAGNRYQVEAPGSPAGGVYFIDARDCTGLVALNETMQGGDIAWRIENCPAFLVRGGDFIGLAGRTLLRDSGGNTGGKFLDYEALDFDAQIVIGSDSGIKYRPRSFPEFYQSLTSLPNGGSAMTGRGLAFDDTTPQITEVWLFPQEIAIKPRCLGGYLHIEANIPYLSLDIGASNVALTLWESDGASPPAYTFLALLDTQRVTSGSTSGAPVPGRAVIAHAITDFSTEKILALALACKDSDRTLVIDTRFNGADQPWWRVWEGPANNT